VVDENEHFQCKKDLMDCGTNDPLARSHACLNGFDEADHGPCHLWPVIIQMGVEKAEAVAKKILHALCDERAGGRRGECNVWIGRGNRSISSGS
jgi:hypothetical protein